MLESLYEYVPFTNDFLFSSKIQCYVCISPTAVTNIINVHVLTLNIHSTFSCALIKDYTWFGKKIEHFILR